MGCIRIHDWMQFTLRNNDIVDRSEMYDVVMNQLLGNPFGGTLNALKHFRRVVIPTDAINIRIFFGYFFKETDWIERAIHHHGPAVELEIYNWTKFFDGLTTTFKKKGLKPFNICLYEIKLK